MRLILSFFLLFFGLIHSESNIGSVKKKQLSFKDDENFRIGVEFLKDKTIKIILPFESGYRKDLYSPIGNLLQSEYYNFANNMTKSEVLTGSEIRQYNPFGFLEKVQTFDKDQNLISSLTFLYDTNCLKSKKDESCMSEISFIDGSKNPIENEDGIHKYKTEFDSVCLQNEKKKPSECKKLELKLNKKLRLTADKDGIAKVYRTFDTFGNLNLYEIYNKFGRIKHKVIYAYDYECIRLTNKPQGCIIFQEYSNQIEKSQKQAKTINYGKKKITYDLNCVQEKRNGEKCISSEENYDINGKLQDIAYSFTFGCMDYSLELGAYAKKKSSFDEKGNEVSREFYDSKNQLIEDSSGGAKYVYAYDQECLDKGYKTQYCRTLSEIYDKNLKLKYKVIYDVTCVRTGNAILEEPNYCTAWKETYDLMQVNGKAKDKIRIVKADFDKNGFRISLEKYNINQELSIKTVYFFDKEKLTKKENQDVNGDLIEDMDGIASYKYEYGHEKFTTKEETFGRDGKLKDNLYGIARMIFAYDDNCLRKKSNRYECTILEEFYDAHENPVELSSDIEDTNYYAKKVREFDTKGNLIMESYFDKNHKLKKNHKGIAKYNFSYDDKGELIEEKQYGEKSNLKQKILFTYDVECKILSKDNSCNTSTIYLDKMNRLLDKEIFEDIAYAKEITSYNLACIKTTGDPEECIEKKEYLNSKKEIIYAEYFKYIDPSSLGGEIKIIKLKLNQDKIPYSAEFIK